jgi:hypothetical protein
MIAKNADALAEIERLLGHHIRAKRVTRMLPVLESVLSGFGAPNQKLPIRHHENMGTPTNSGGAGMKWQ